jgi:hypothetical protein
MHLRKHVQPCRRVAARDGRYGLVTVDADPPHKPACAFVVSSKVPGRATKFDRFPACWWRGKQCRVDLIIDGFARVVDAQTPYLCYAAREFSTRAATAGTHRRALDVLRFTRLAEIFLLGAESFTVSM